jgi:hypothetical protein
MREAHIGQRRIPATMSPASPSRLPRRVVYTIVAATVVAAIAVMVTGHLPSRASGAEVLPFYFAAVLLVLAMSYVVSGNTLMHHHRTGTIQRPSSPVAFWCVVGAQLLAAAVLFAIGFMNPAA